MKPQELKREYVRLRAEGKSYSAICEQLHIAKATCTSWEKELAAEIDELKRAELAELCESYGMTKEARIKKLGATLGKIEEALAQADYTSIDPVKLLEYKLRYTEALKGEYVGTKPALNVKDITPGGIVEALGDLLNRVRAGDVTTDQARKETEVLTQLLRAYETTEVKAKLDELEAIIGGRVNSAGH